MQPQSGQPQPGNSSLDLVDLLRPARKWWWLLAASALLAGFSSALYTSQQPLVYRSSTTVMVGTAIFDPNPNSSEFMLASQLAQAYADIAGRSTVRVATQEALGMEWLPEYYVRHIPGTQLLEITVVDTMPERAQLVAKELANQLIRQSPGGRGQQDRQQFIEEQLAQLEVSIVETKNEIERLELELAGMFSARQIADTKGQIEALQSKLATLQVNYTNLLANSQRAATNTIMVVEEAYLPAFPLNSDMKRNVALATVVGFAMAAAAAYLLELAHDTFSVERELQRTLGLPTLGLLPKGPADTPQVDFLAASLKHRTAQSDAYAAFRLNLLAVVRRQEVRTLMLSCPGLEEGSAVVTANLSSELARAGQQIILIDADLHRPLQQRLFNVPNLSGLTTALTEPDQPLDELLQATAVPGLRILTSGPLPANPTPLLSSQRMQDVLGLLQEKADLVIVQGPSMMEGADALVLASEVGGVVLVVAAGRTTRGQIDQAAKAIARIGAQLLGIVLWQNSAPPAKRKTARHPPFRHEAGQPNGEEIIVHVNGHGSEKAALTSPPGGSMASKPRKKPFGRF